jgi:hypothetical protein
MRGPGVVRVGYFDFPCELNARVISCNFGLFSFLLQFFRSNSFVPLISNLAAKIMEEQNSQLKKLLRIISSLKNFLSKKY